MPTRVFVICLALFTVGLSAQDPVISRSAPMTLTGEIVDITCYKQKGAVGGTGVAHVSCAKDCVLEKGASLGILTNGDGLFRIWGTMARDKYVKLMPYVGQTVSITGSEVVLSNNYDVRSFDLQTIKAAKKAGDHDERKAIRRRGARGHPAGVVDGRRGAKSGARGQRDHLHEARRADSAAVVSDLSPARHERAHVAADLRRRASVGAREQGAHLGPHHAAVAHRAQRRDSAIQGRSVSDRRRDRDDRGVV
jgi:hypothetical protein